MFSRFSPSWLDRVFYIILLNYGICFYSCYLYNVHCRKFVLVILLLWHNFLFITFPVAGFFPVISFTNSSHVSRIGLCCKLWQGDLFWEFSFVPWPFPFSGRFRAVLLSPYWFTHWVRVNSRSGSKCFGTLSRARHKSLRCHMFRNCLSPLNRLVGPWRLWLCLFNYQYLLTFWGIGMGCWTRTFVCQDKS